MMALTPDVHYLDAIRIYPSGDRAQVILRHPQGGTRPVVVARSAIESWPQLRRAVLATSNGAFDVVPPTPTPATPLDLARPMATGEPAATTDAGRTIKLPDGTIQSFPA